MPSPLSRRLRPAVLIALAFAGLYGAAAVAQDEEVPSTRPSRTLSVTLPYSLLDDLTDEQRDEVIAIRTDIMEEIRQLKADEERRILAVLTAEQRERLPELYREYRRDRAAARRANNTADAAAEEAADDAEASPMP